MACEHQQIEYRLLPHYLCDAKGKLYQKGIQPQVLVEVRSSEPDNYDAYYFPVFLAPAKTVGEAKAIAHSYIDNCLVIDRSNRNNIN